ncbi:MAG: tetratricopeptide repeat protein [Calditrichota bacterium]
MNNLIKLYQDAGLWDSAIAMAKQYVQEFPNVDDNFATRILVGTFLTNMGEFNRAIDYFEGLLQEADSESAAEIQYYIGEAYFKQNKFKQAITEYLKVPYLNPHTKLDWSTNALWYAGQSYERLGDVDRAIALYRRIVDEKGATSNYGRFALKRIDQLTNQPPQQ